MSFLNGKSLLFGVISIVIGVFGIFISLGILFLIKTIYGDAHYYENVIFLAGALKVLVNVEIVVKPLGLLSAIIGLSLRGNKKKLSMIGLIINIVSIIFTFCLMYGFI